MSMKSVESEIAFQMLPCDPKRTSGRQWFRLRQRLVVQFVEHDAIAPDINEEILSFV